MRGLLVVGLLVLGCGLGVVATFGVELMGGVRIAPLASASTPTPTEAPVATPLETPEATPTPLPSPAASCTLWSSDGQWNVTIFGDHQDHDFPGYCAVAQRSRLAMHVAGPPAGTATCDMTDPGSGERFVFQDTVSRTYLPCDRVAPFFQAIRAAA
jgi:hypothetical protein